MFEADGVTKNSQRVEGSNMQQRVWWLPQDLWRFKSNVYTGLKYPPQLDSPFLPEAMFFVFVLGSPLVNKDLQYIPPN